MFKSFQSQQQPSSVPSASQSAVRSPMSMTTDSPQTNKITLTNRLSSFLLAISAAFSSLDIPTMLVDGVVGSVAFGRGRGDDIGVDLVLEAGENAGTPDLRGCGESAREIWEGGDVHG